MSSKDRLADFCEKIADLFPSEEEPTFVLSVLVTALSSYVAASGASIERVISTLREAYRIAEARRVEMDRMEELN